MVAALSFGGGVNSTALIAGMVERGVQPPAWLLFADTGGEHAETYDHVAAVDAWLEQRAWPRITRVSNAGQHASLEAECLTNRTLPSLAFGNKGCSVKWKRQPQERFLRDQPAVQEAWARGELVTRFLGIDAGEEHRAAGIPDDNRWRYEFPLIRWGWDRQECVAAIKRLGMPMPRKSACWFCPANRKAEVVELAREHPELFKRAVAMEDNAELTTVKGLGRSYSWAELVKAEQSQRRLWPELELPCMCMDGTDD